MNLATTALLALSMSMDAFAVAVGKGAALRGPRFAEALRTGLIFGAVEAVTPVLGWLFGRLAVPFVDTWSHWIAFTLLGLLGLRMIHAGLSSPHVDDGRPHRHGFWLLAITAVGTSIDALAVGVGLAFLDVDIVAAAAAIGLATAVMVTLGVMVGRMFGLMLGRRAEVAGGLVLIGIGVALVAGRLPGA